MLDTTPAAKAKKTAKLRKAKTRKLIEQLPVGEPHRWIDIAEGFEMCTGCRATRRAGTGREGKSCPGMPPDLRGHLYKIDGLVTALVRQIDDLYEPREPIPDLSDEGHMALSGAAWPAVVLVEQLQRMLKTAGEMAEEMEAA